MRVLSLLVLASAVVGAPKISTGYPKTSDGQGALLASGKLLSEKEGGCTVRDTVPVPLHYAAYKLGEDELIRLDGHLDDAAWGKVRWTHDFVDIVGSPPKDFPRYNTKAKIRWDDTHLYVAAKLDEPEVWASIDRRNEVIFKDNDFEVFVDVAGSNHHYKEIEINANNQVWCLHLPKPYGDGGSEDSRRVNKQTGYDIPHMQTAVKVQGTMNTHGDNDEGWTVEMAIPIKDLLKFTNESMPEAGKSKWRINFSRVEHQVEMQDAMSLKILNKPEDNWVWSPQNEVQMHDPETWGYLLFRGAKEIPAEGEKAGPIEWEDPDRLLRQAAMKVYHIQNTVKKDTGGFAKTADELLEIMGGNEAAVNERGAKPTDTNSASLLALLDVHCADVAKPQVEFVTPSSADKSKYYEAKVSFRGTVANGRHAVITADRKLVIVPDA